MNISQNITEAQHEYANMYHVVSSIEVHSFESKKEAEADLEEAIVAEEKINSGFIPSLITPKPCKIK